MAKSNRFSGILIAIVLLALAGGGGWYYLNGKGDAKPEYTLVKTSRGDLVQTVTATGDLQPVVTVDIGAQVSGLIKDVLVDYNAVVKAGDVLARIDESTPAQRVEQSKADLASAEANNKLIILNAQRTRELFAKNLVSQQELDSAEAQLSQSNATMLQRTAALENAKLDLSRCTITAPIDGMVLDRKTDKGRTVNANMNAPVLFTLVNDLSKMQINAAVAEADVGLISSGQEVKFTVDAFPNRTFNGTVRMVRNAATVSQSVVSYATIIEVANDDLKLKPGMTANVSIIVTQRNNILKVPNQALRVRLPQEIQAKVTQAPGSEKQADKGASKAPAGGGSTDRRAIFEVMREAGMQMGQPPAPDVIEKAKKLAAEKGLDAEAVNAFITRMASGGGRGGSGGGGGRGEGGGRGGNRENTFTNTVTTRTVYRVVGDPNADEKRLEAVSVKLGVSDGFNTEVLEGLGEADTLVTAVVMPGAAAAASPAPGGMNNPFQGGGRSGFGGSSGGMRGGR
jgi:HlyD family secretion protein